MNPHAFHITLLLTLVPCAPAAIVSGSFVNRDSWRFLARFCFQAGQHLDITSDKRKLTYKITFEEKACCPTLNLYFDSPEQWASVYKSNLSCKEKVDKAKETISLTKSRSNCVREGGMIQCEGLRYVTGVRARWWYVAVSNCERHDGLAFNYTLTFTNGDHFTDRHFSADELGVLETTAVALVMMVVICTVTVIYSRLLSRRRLNHETFKTFQTSTFFYLLNCLFATVYYCYFGYHGQASRGYLVTARIMDIIATSSFLGLLLGFSTGFTIVSATMSICSFSVMLTFTGMFSLLMVCCLIWEGNVFDPAAVLYTYMSPPGYLLAGIHLPAWLYFVTNCSYTCYKFTRKRNFYCALCLFYSVWLLCLPLLIMIANTAIPDWIRMKTVTITQQFVWIASYVYLLVIFMPTQSNKHFPFHLRVTKVDLGVQDTAQDNNYVVTKESTEAERSQIEMVNDENTDINKRVDIFTVS